MRSRYAKKRDTSERIIIDALVAVGATVAQVDGTNLPDLLVGFRGMTYLMEAKTGKAKLRPGQATWRETWRGGVVHVVRSVDDALEAIGVRA